MATSPDISKGEGITRMYEFLSFLVSDIQCSIEHYQKNKNSQYFRRNIVRCVFSFIEGIIQILKFELKFDLRHEDITISKEEEKFLYEYKEIDGKKVLQIIPLDKNLKNTISLLTKLWGLQNVNINVSSKLYEAFLNLKNYTRNKLTHPNNFYDIEISEEEIKEILITYEWFRNGFSSIIEERINIISETMPNDVVNKFKIAGLEEYNNVIKKSSRKMCTFCGFIRKLFFKIKQLLTFNFKL